MALIVADTLSESGHSKFNDKIINWMAEDEFDYISFFSSDCSIDDTSASKRINFSKNYLSKRYMIIYVLFQMLLHFRLIFLSFINDKKVILLSYEIYSFSLASHIYALLGINVVVIEHNTVPDKKNKIKSIFFSAISSNVKHLCLEQYISEYITCEFSKRTGFFSHPILGEVTLNKTMDDVFYDYLFMPSSTVQSETADSIIELFIANPEQKLLMKDIGTLKANNVIKNDFFDDYYKLLMNARGVILPQDFSYRVSGVFYESLSYTNVIYMTPCIMAYELKK